MENVGFLESSSFWCWQVSILATVAISFFYFVGFLAVSTIVHKCNLGSELSTVCFVKPAKPPFILSFSAANVAFSCKSSIFCMFLHFTE